MSNFGGWTMQIPVLSLKHLPSSNPFVPGEHPVARWEYGFFVYIDEVPEQQFMKDVREWLNANGFEDASWVRFDDLGEIAEGLPTYEW